MEGRNIESISTENLYRLENSINIEIPNKDQEGQKEGKKLKGEGNALSLTDIMEAINEGNRTIHSKI